MIIDSTYFWGLTNTGFVSSAVGSTNELKTLEMAELNRSITAYEDKFLTLIFGDLKADYLACRTTEDKWKAVDAYVVNAETKLSMIADYVFCQYWDALETSVDKDGYTYKILHKDRRIVSNAMRTVDVWNRMAYLVMDLLVFLDDNLSTYETEEKVFNHDGWTTFYYVQGNEAFPLLKNHFGL